MRTLLAISLAALACLLAAPTDTEADHSNNGHTGYLYSDVQQYEMNSRTTAALPVAVQLSSGGGSWPSLLTTALGNWNSVVSPTAGFNVFSGGSGNINVWVDTNTQCPTGAHACVKDWSPATPSANIRLLSSTMTNDTHRLSNLMHELGHVLLNANEHYPAYNCTSIMGHSSNEQSGSGPNDAGWCGQNNVVNGNLPAVVKTTVQAHDVTDYRDAFGVEDDQNAAYITMLGSATTIHYFEGNYLGGNGRAAHQEFETVIDRSTTGVNPPGNGYVFYGAAPRRVDNTDNGNPENVSFASVPPNGAEWCFKLHAHSKAVAPGSLGEWGPFSKRYCIARSGSGNGVFVTSDRNGNANFRVWNFSGATITNVQLRTAPSPGVQKCVWSSVANNAGSSSCAVNISGPGFLDVWYNGTYVPLDQIGYE